VLCYWYTTIFTTLYSWSYFCKKLNKVYQILIDNKVDFQEIYNKLEINGSDVSEEISKLKPDKLQVLTDIYELVKDYISIELLAKIFSMNHHENLYLLYLYYNYFKNTSIKNNIENVINKYHYNQCDYHAWFHIIFNNLDEQEQDAIETDKEPINYFITELLKKMQNNSFQENYENVKNIIKELNLKYTEDNNKHYKIGKCDNPSCDGNLYQFKDQIVCNICQKVYCSKCRKEIYPKEVERMIDYKIEILPNPLYSEYTKEQKEEKHECKQEDIETVKLLTKNIKNCPNP